MKNLNPKNHLLKIAGGLAVTLTASIAVPEITNAAVCNTSNPSSIPASGCYNTPNRYVVKIYEMGLCTSDPLSGTNYDGSTCTATFSNATGADINVAAGTASLSDGTSTRPPNGSYGYAYIKMKNTFGLKGSFQLNSTTYCSKADGTANSASGCTAANFTETLKAFGGSCSTPYDSDDAIASEVLTEGTMKARLTNSSYSTVTACNATNLVGSLSLNSPVVIASSTKGLEVKFTVTNSGMTIIPTNGDTSTVSAFGGGPFQAVFSLY